MWRVIFASGVGFGLSAGALAGPFTGTFAAAPECAIETLPAARAACLDFAADTRLAAIDAEIERLASGAQGARPEAIREFRSVANARQAAWREAMEAACANAGAATIGDARVAQGECRLAQSRSRLDEIRRLVADALVAQGRGPALPGLTGEDVEIFVPLPRRPPRGPGRPYLDLSLPPQFP